MRNKMLPCPPIYVINLKRSPEKKLYMQRQLDAFGLNYQFVDAIDKYDLEFKDYRMELAHRLDICEYQFERIYKSQKEDKFFACSLSHIKVYNLMIEHNIPIACVLEDNEYLFPTFPDALILSQEISWDVLLLAHKVWLLQKAMYIYIKDIRTKKIKAIALWYYIYRLTRQTNISLYTMRLIYLKTLKYMLNVNKSILSTIEQHSIAYASSIGAIPVPRSSWHNPMPDHYIARPYMIGAPGSSSFNGFLPTTAAAYMLTQSAAKKWKEAAISIPKPIDNVHFIYSNTKSNIDVHIFMPPCVVPEDIYLKYSTHYQ